MMQKHTTALVIFISCLLGLFGTQSAWAQSCQQRADDAQFNDSAQVIEGSSEFFVTTPESIVFATSEPAPLLIEDISEAGRDSTLRLFSVDTANQAITELAFNDDANALRPRIRLGSVPAATYCVDVAAFRATNILDLNIVIEASTTAVATPLSDCRREELAQFGYILSQEFIQVSSLERPPGAFTALGTVRFLTDGMLELEGGTGIDTLLHPLDNPDNTVNLTDPLGVTAGSTWCIFQRAFFDSSFVQFTPTENIFDNGFIEFPPEEVRLAEADGATSISVNLREPIELDIGIDVEIDRNSDASSADFTENTFLGSFQQLLIPAGQTSADVAIPLNDDSVEEAAEVVRVQFFRRFRQTNIPDAVVNLVIEDNDAPAQPNRNPAFNTAISTLTGVAGESFSISVSASDPDGDPLDFTLSNAPGWLGVNVAQDRRSASLNGNAPQSGTFSNISLNIDDGRGGTASMIFSISIAAAEPQPPATPQPPVDSEQPTAPQQPVDSEQPTTPQQPAPSLDQPTEDGAQTPTTSVETNSGSGGGGAISLLLLLPAVLRRRKPAQPII